MKKNVVSLRLDLDEPPPLTALQREEFDRLAAQGDAPIDYSDIPQSDWSGAVRFREHLYRPIKQPTTVRIDADVLDWLKSKGKGYQTRLNAILREAMRREAG